MSFVAVGIALVGGATSAIMASKARKDAKSRQRKAEDKIAALERTRQKVEDPYKNVQDLSGMITNPYANLQVATKAAELQGEEADISLASTLDTMRASGAGAGGATALAQAALRSKLGISANIEQQEAQNARMRAQGQAQMSQMRMAEAQRIQQAGIEQVRGWGDSEHPRRTQIPSWWDCRLSDGCANQQRKAVHYSKAR